MSYPAVGAPISVDPTSGYLYATAGAAINGYAPGSNKIAVSLNVQPPESCRSHGSICTEGPLTALRADAQGYLYVGFDYGLCTNGRYGRSCIFQFIVQVYPPGASGNALPIASIDLFTCNYGRLARCAGSVGGLALDAGGDLLVSYWEQECAGKIFCRRTRRVATYASPTTNPQLARVFEGIGTRFPNGLAIDAKRELYVDNPTNASFNKHANSIAVYPVTANGRRSPSRTLEIQGAQTLGLGIDVSSSPRLLYVPDIGANAVYVVYASGKGLQQPVATLSVGSPADAKLGP